MLNMTPLARHVLSLQTSLCRQFILGTIILPTPPLLCSNSNAHLCNLYNYIAPTLRLTVDQYQTHSDLVPMPRTTIYIPFLHLSSLPDPFSLTIVDNYSCLVYILSVRVHPRLVAYIMSGY